MASQHYDMPEYYSQFLERANQVFTLLYLVELLIKLLAMGAHFDFEDPWNQFDAVVVVLSLISMVLLDFVLDITTGSTAVILLRVVRIGRLFRLIKKAKTLRRLLSTMLFSLPALLNVFGLMFLIISIYAILGQQAFYN